MMNPQQWASLGVQDFFNGFNWTGEPPKLPPMTNQEELEVEIEPLTEVDWMSLTLQDVLNCGNWEGMTLIRTRQRSSTPSQPPVTFDPLFSLKLPVQSFFAGIPWRGKDVSPVVASSPKEKKNRLTEAIPESSDDWTITDLSDLL